MSILPAALSQPILCGMVLLALFGHQAKAQLVSLAVNSAYREVKGTTTNVPGSGTPENYVAYNPNLFAVFQMNQTLSGVGFSTVDMRVKVNASTFGVTDLMIARTTNSQGLTDPGTVSILFIGGPSATVSNYQYNLSLDFEFGSWNDATSTWTPGNLTNRLTVTTFDIDFTQYARVNVSDFGSMTRDGNTRLQVTPNVTIPNGPTPVPAGTYQIGDMPSTDSVFNEPRNAVTFNSVGSSDFNMSFGKATGSGPSLHMFEFRTPATNVTYVNPFLTEIPEPSVFGLAGAGLLFGTLLCGRRRRSARA